MVDDVTPSWAPVRTGLLIALAVIVFDQATKWWIITQVMSPPQVIEVLPVFNLVMAWNKGVSFGLFASGSPAAVWMFVAIAVGVSGALVVWLRTADTLWVIGAIGAIIGGALGNAVDRVRLGAVADFLDFHIAGYHWPAFNVADTAITLGAGVLILDSLFRTPKSLKKEPDGES